MIESNFLAQKTSDSNGNSIEMNSKGQKPDAELFHAYLKGDVQAFTLLFKKYQSPIYGFIYQMVEDRAVANDLFQETFFRMIQKGAQYREVGSFRAWLFKLANGICIDFLRKRTRERKLFQPVQTTESVNGRHSNLDLESSPELELISNEETKLLWRALRQLPVEQRQVFLLRLESNLTFKEIASILHRPLNTTLSQMRYAILNLRKQLKEEV
ncbi:MAG: RNA polymerase sigma factor [bacterium]